MDIWERLFECSEFEWDEHNSTKIQLKHSVYPLECEQLFFLRPLIVTVDEKHSDHEARYFALGVTDEGRKLFTVFTIRKEKIRIISARDMSRKERKEFERHEENS